MRDPMRDPARIERILTLIRDLWTDAPDARLGQLLLNVSPAFSNATFECEDDDLERDLRTALKPPTRH